MPPIWLPEQLELRSDDLSSLLESLRKELDSVIIAGVLIPVIPTLSLPSLAPYLCKELGEEVSPNLVSPEKPIVTETKERIES